MCRGLGPAHSGHAGQQVVTQCKSSEHLTLLELLETAVTVKEILSAVITESQYYPNSIILLNNQRKVDKQSAYVKSKAIS